MNFLRSQKINFDDSDNVAKWDCECNFGVTINDSPRALDKPTVENLNNLVSAISTDRDNMEWDSSAGIFGICYYKDANHKSLCSNIYGEIYDKTSALDQLWSDNDFVSPWTWEGAPVKIA